MKLKKKNIFYFGIIIIILLYVFVFDDYSLLQRFSTIKELNELEQNLNDLLKENERLREENEKLIHDKNIWEKKARELGMQKNGDEVYHFKLKDK